MKNIMLLLIITCLGFAVAEDAVKTVTSGVIEVGPVVVVSCSCRACRRRPFIRCVVLVPVSAELLWLTPELDA
jgi:hypothetical protein